MAEILTALVIVAVIASIAVPGFLKAKTKAEKNQAIAYLRSIRAAQKIYYGKWRTFVNTGTTALIESTLGAEAKATGYNFAATGTATTFSATATRTSDSQTLTLNQNGVWSGTNTPLPAND